MARRPSKPSPYARIWRTVSRVPRGRVATYGQIAELAGLGGHARQVGYALHALPHGTRVPWQRVVNARGEVSARSEPGAESLQRALLLAEGVRFDARGRIELARYAWRHADEGRKRPRAAAAARSEATRGHASREPSGGRKGWRPRG